MGSESLNKIKYDICDFATDILSVDGKKYVCLTCYKSLSKGKTPSCSVRNGMKFPPLPDELSDLTELEERLIASRLPFMQLRSAKCGRQWKIFGNVINVPSNADSTVKAIPRTLDKTLTIPVKLKRKMAYKHSYIYENICPAKVRQAAEILVKNSVLQEGMVLNHDWLCQSDPCNIEHDCTPGPVTIPCF